MGITTIEIPSCEEIPEFPDLTEIVLPGGATLSQVISASKSVPNVVDMGLNLLQQVQPALAPLVPLFDIIDAVVAVYKCVTAIPDALGPPPDPTVLSKCLPDLAKKVAKLLKLIPQLSLPLTIKAVIDGLIATLGSVRSQLLALKEQLSAAAKAAERAAELDDQELSAIASCSRANVEQHARNLGESLASLGKLVALVNVFLKTLGVPEIPLASVTSLSGKSLDEVIEPLDALVTTLKQVRQAVPVP